MSSWQHEHNLTGSDNRNTATSLNVKLYSLTQFNCETILLRHWGSSLLVGLPKWVNAQVHILARMLLCETTGLKISCSKIKTYAQNLTFTSKKASSVYTILYAVYGRYLREWPEQKYNSQTPENKLVGRKYRSSVFSVFFGRYSVFFGICNTDVGIGIGITDPGLL